MRTPGIFGTQYETFHLRFTRLKPLHHKDLHVSTRI